jgi:SAM-dependent methyltransferase
MTAGNIAYQGAELAQYFSATRTRWDHLYPSERWMLTRLAGEEGRIGRVLDVGCAAAGLCAALCERFAVDSYVGVDINAPVVETARARLARLRVPSAVHHGDILELEGLDGERFDLVVSLSCADWNVESEAIIDACWRRVRPGGHFLISVRLTPERGVNDVTRSYQPITPDGTRRAATEHANYVVFNVRDFLRLTAALPAADEVVGYGYWGEPSVTAVTPYGRLVFAVFAIRRGDDGTPGATSELHLPLSLLTAPEPSP